MVASMPMRADLHDTLWIDEAGKRSLLIERRGEQVVVTVWRGLGPTRLLDAGLARWRPHRDPTSSNPMRRLDVLQVEAGADGMGSTYDLMVACANHDASAFGGFGWRPAAADTPLSELRLFPQLGASFYEAVLGAYDDFVEEERGGLSWAEPYSTYRPMTPAERARHTSAHAP